MQCVIYISKKSQYVKNEERYGKTIHGVPLSFHFFYFMYTLSIHFFTLHLIAVGLSSVGQPLICLSNGEGLLDSSEDDEEACPVKRQSLVIKAPH